MHGQANRAHTVALTTLGCKLNQAETEDLARKFLDGGFRVVDIDDVADAYVINTCTVTHIADRKSRQIIRQIRRLNPAAIVAATGCYVDVSPSEVQKIDHVDLLVKNPDKPQIAELVSEALGESPDYNVPESSGSVLYSPRTRAFIKIEDGCNKFCSFCIVPVARGRERSLPVDGVVASVAERVAAGHKEVVLTGVHIGTYGNDFKNGSGADLNDLVKAVLQRTDVARLRLSSVEPMDFKPAMLSIWSDRRVCRHIHLPLQSGSDAVLKRMRRHYTQKGFARIVGQIRAAIPGVAITTDIIAGFPGETESEFQETLDFARNMGFAAIHVFKYSPRRGTFAAVMPDQIPHEIKKSRSEALLELAEASISSFASKFIGQSLEVLYETAVAEEMPPTWEGLTDNYLRVRTVCGEDLANQIRDTELVSFVDGHLVGSVRDSAV